MVPVLFLGKHESNKDKTTEETKPLAKTIKYSIS